MSKKTGLELLREPFEDRHIGKLPKPTKSQTEEVKKDYRKGIRCDVCGGWHHPNVVHLDYVGHAALTDRLLDCDDKWYWEPLAFNEQGLPAFDDTGGLWIRLTVSGVSRLGYGNAEDSAFKEVGSREKEVIGDALRNAAMRFGAALDLWHKGDLHENEEIEEKVNDGEEYKALVKANEASVNAVKISLAENDYSTAKEAWHELSQETQTALWRAPSKGGCFSTKERSQMKSTEWSEAK